MIQQPVHKAPVWLFRSNNDNARGRVSRTPLPAAVVCRGNATENSVIASLRLFSLLHELCERHPTENEQAQDHEYDEAVRRRRDIFWHLHRHIVCPGEFGALT